MSKLVVFCTVLLLRLLWKTSRYFIFTRSAEEVSYARVIPKVSFGVRSQLITTKLMWLCDATLHIDLRIPKYAKVVSVLFVHLHSILFTL